LVAQRGPIVLERLLAIKIAYLPPLYDTPSLDLQAVSSCDYELVIIRGKHRFRAAAVPLPHSLPWVGPRPFRVGCAPAWDSPRIGKIGLALALPFSFLAALCRATLSRAAPAFRQNKLPATDDTSLLHRGTGLAVGPLLSTFPLSLHVVSLPTFLDLALTFQGTFWRAALGYPCLPGTQCRRPRKP